MQKREGEERRYMEPPHRLTRKIRMLTTPAYHLACHACTCLHNILALAMRSFSFSLPTSSSTITTSFTLRFPIPLLPHFYFSSFVLFFIFSFFHHQHLLIHLHFNVPPTYRKFLLIHASYINAFSFLIYAYDIIVLQERLAFANERSLFTAFPPPLPLPSPYHPFVSFSPL